MAHRRLTETVLLGASLLLGIGQSHGDVPEGREVIATSVPVAPTTPPAPFPLSQPPTATTARPAPAPMAPGMIQQAAFVDAPPRPPAGPRMPENGLIPQAAPAPASAASAPSPERPSSNGLMSGTVAPPSAPASGLPSATATLVSVEVIGPSQVAQGQPLPHEIVVRNTGARAVTDVHVEEPLPSGVRVLHAEPAGQTHGDRLTWDLGALEGGAEQRLKVEVQPAAAGELHLQPVVTFRLGSGLRTQVVRPAFAVEMTAKPEQTRRGGPITFTIRLTNHGDTLIRAIKLYDQLPAGLRHPKGERIGVNHFGDLQPGETRSLTLETTAVGSGRLRNEVVAEADGGIEARAAIEVTVTEPALALRVDGAKKGLTQRDLDFHLEVANPGPAPATKVRLIQALPPSFEVVGASTGAGLDEAQHALVWTLGDLAAGQRQTVTFRVKARTAGDWPLYTAVLADNVPETRAANVLHVEGASALTLEVRAREDRLAVGEETVYEMHVFNQGDAPSAGLRLTAFLPDEVTPLDTQGPTSGQVRQQQVQFLPVGQLPPRGDAVYLIHVRGQRPGKGQVRVELTAEHEQPVESEMSVQIRGDSPASATGTIPASHTKPIAGEELR